MAELEHKPSQHINWATTVHKRSSQAVAQFYVLTGKGQNKQRPYKDYTELYFQDSVCNGNNFSHT